MKTLARTLCAVAIAALVPSVAAAASSSQSVTGSGWRGPLAEPTTPITHFVVSAHVGPQGAGGTYRSMNSRNALLNFAGDVTCISFDGDHAVVGGVVTGGGVPGQIGTGFAVGFVDGSSPTADSVTLTDAELATPVDCTAETALFGFPTLPVLEGNDVIKDS